MTTRDEAITTWRSRQAGAAFAGFATATRAALPSADPGAPSVARAINFPPNKKRLFIPACQTRPHYTRPRWPVNAPDRSGQRERCDGASKAGGEDIPWMTVRRTARERGLPLSLL